MSLEEAALKYEGLTSEELARLLDYTSPEYSEEVSSLLEKIFTNTHLPVSFYKHTGLLSGSFSSMHSRASGDIREIVGKRLANSKFRKSIEEMNIPDYIQKMGSGFFKEVFAEYGDDSIARMVSLTASFEDVSMLQAMHMLHHRTLFGIEKSTRYKPYHKKSNGKYKYLVDPLIIDNNLDGEFRKVTDSVFDLYSRLISPGTSEYKKVRNYLSKKLPFSKFSEKVLSSIEGTASYEELETAYSRTINAMHKDSIRHLIPLSAKTSLSLEMNAEAMRQLLFSLQAIGTGESLITQQLIHNEASKLVGPLLDGTEVSSSRAKAYRNFISETRKPRRLRGEDTKLIIDIREDSELGFTIHDQADYIRLRDEEYDIEIQARMKGNLPDIITNILREQNSGMTYGQAVNYSANMSSSEKENLVLDYAGIPDLRTNRRYRPGRAFEAVSFDKTLIMPIGEIRDLRRHTLQSYLDPKYFTPENGFYISEAVRESGIEKQVKEIMGDIDLFYDILRGSTNPYVASSILTLAHRAPMNVEVNARNQHHIDELRTQPGAAPLYLKLCQMDYAAVSYLLPILKKTMTFVNKDSSEIDYGRSIQEVRRLKKIKKAKS